MCTSFCIETKAHCSPVSKGILIHPHPSCFKERLGGCGFARACEHDTNVMHVMFTDIIMSSTFQIHGNRQKNKDAYSRFPVVNMFTWHTNKNQHCLARHKWQIMKVYAYRDVLQEHVVRVVCLQVGIWSSENKNKHCLILLSELLFRGLHTCDS